MLSMHFIYKATKYSLLLASLSLSLSTQADPINWGSPYAAPWTNKYRGMASHVQPGQKTALQVEGLFPYVGSASRIFFLDGQFHGANNNVSLTALGTGSRYLRPFGEKVDMILGGFLFSEYQSLARSDAWFINPGIELFLPKHEVTLQYYYPMTGTQKTYAYTTAANAPGNLDNANEISGHTFYSGHTLYDTAGRLVNEYGNGFTIEGTQLLNFGDENKINLGAYYFAYPTSASIQGVEASIVLKPVKHIKVKLQDNYDNQKGNEVTFSIMYTFGGYHNDERFGMMNKMETLINHHVARPAYAQVTPVYNKFIPNGGSNSGPTPVSSNNWFFSAARGTAQGGAISLANCTFENPCLNLTQDIADGIQTVMPTGAALQFETGTYALQANGSAGGAQAVLLHDQQGIYGRTLYWKNPATSTDRPQISGALFWGNAGGASPELASGSIDDMVVSNTNAALPQTITGLGGLGPEAVLTTGATNQLSMTNSLITATSSSSATDAVGSWALNGSLAMTGSTVNAQSTQGGGVYGLMTDNGAISFSNSQAQLTSSSGSRNSGGLLSLKNNVSVLASQIQIQTSGSGAAVYGVNAEEGTLSFKQSTVQVTSTGSNSNTVGLFAKNGMNLEGASVTAVSQAGSIAYGLQNSSGTILFSNQASYISASNLGGGTTGAIDNIPGVLILNQSLTPSKCTTNGVTVDC